MKKIALMLASAAFLSACATGYTTGGWKGGQTPKWRDVDVVEIVSRGNAATSGKKLGQMTLLRAAETAIEADYRYFIAINEQDAGKSGTVYLPQTANTYHSGSISPYRYSGTSTSYMTGGPISYYKPGINAIYKLFTELPVGARPGQFYDIYEVYNEFGPKFISDFEPKSPN